jgi:hypothetical protein
MIDVARQAPHITGQIEFLAMHAAGGSRREEADTIAALEQIAEALRSAAAVFERERDQRQSAAALRAERLAVLMRDRENRP